MKYRITIIALFLTSITYGQSSSRDTSVPLQTVIIKNAGGSGTSEGRVQYIIDSTLATMSLDGYTKTQVDSITNKLRGEIGAGGGGDMMKSVYDPIINAKLNTADAFTKANADLLYKDISYTPDLSGKVDKITGKGLSTEDYTTTEKNKLLGIESNASAFNKISADLLYKDIAFTPTWAALPDKPTLVQINDATPSSSTVYSSVKVNSLISGAGGGDMMKATYDPIINGKLDKTDTASMLSPYQLKSQSLTKTQTDLLYKNITYVPSWTDVTGKPTLFSGAYIDLTGKPIIPTKTSDLTNDNGYLTKVDSLEFSTRLRLKKVSDSLGALISGQVVGVSSVNSKTGSVTLTKTDIGLENVDNTSDVNKPVSTVTQNALDLKLNTVNAFTQTNADLLYKSIGYVPTWSSITGKPTFATVATTGSYNDLSDKPAAVDISAKADKTYVDSQDALKADKTAISNINNTSDADKPVSTATNTALATKVDKVTGKALSDRNYTNADSLKLAGIEIGLKLDKSDSTLANRITTLNNRTSNVDNTSDISKPISTATQNALNLKANDADVVHKTGNETVAGLKTFTDNITVTGASSNVFVENSGGGNYGLKLKSTGTSFEAIQVIGGSSQSEATSILFGQYNDGRAFFFNQAENPIGFYTAGNERVSFNGSGLKLVTTSNAIGDFVTRDAGTQQLTYRTPAQALTDIGAEPVIAKGTAFNKNFNSGTGDVIDAKRALDSFKVHRDSIDAMNVKVNDAVTFDPATKLNVSDTAGMLSGYQRTGGAGGSDPLKLNISDTASMIANYAKKENPTFTTKITTPAITLGATAITATGVQINYLVGVTSAIQTQFTAKANLVSPTFTGSPKAPTQLLADSSTNLQTTAGNKQQGAALKTFMAGTYQPKGDPTIDALKAMGSSIKAFTLGANYLTPNTYANNMSNGLGIYTAVYLASDQTLTGAKIILAKQGVYTAGAYNGIGLYKVSGTTATLVASTVNDTAIWKAATGSLISKNFSSTYAATAGLYFVAPLYTSSAETTAPQILNIGATSPKLVTLDFSFPLVGVSYTTLTALPSTKSLTSDFNADDAQFLFIF